MTINQIRREAAAAGVKARGSKKTLQKNLYRALKGKGNSRQRRALKARLGM